MMNYQFQSLRPCRTCGQTHPVVPGTHSTDCIVLGVRTHHSSPSPRRPNKPSSTYSNSNSKYMPPPDNLITIPIPLDIRSQALLFDQIWFWFIDMKHENDRLRDSIQTYYHVDKGTLRAAAPLLWFEWRRWDDVRGQTRNQENWEKVWKRLVWTDRDEQKGKMPVAWITLRSMDPTSASSDIKVLAQSPQKLRKTILA